MKIKNVLNALLSIVLIIVGIALAFVADRFSPVPESLSSTEAITYSLCLVVLFVIPIVTLRVRNFRVKDSFRFLSIKALVGFPLATLIERTLRPAYDANGILIYLALSLFISFMLIKVDVEEETVSE